MKSVLQKLVKGESLSAEEATETMTLIAEGKSDPAQVGAFLALLSAKGETEKEITALASVMRKFAVKVELPYDNVLDVVGTGGDGHNTINISTSASIVAAACGCKVAKHGSKSVSSKSGSSDVLQKLGVKLLSPNEIKPCIQEAGIAFMFAPNFHPAMKHVVPVRRSLAIRTVFNILGPLLNPAGANRLLLGVYSPSLLDVYAQVVCNLGVDHGLIVHCCGLDELAPVGVAEMREIKGTEITKVKLDPAAVGIEMCSISDLEGDLPEKNAEIIRDLFKGGDVVDGPVGRTIALNAGAALYVYGSAGSIKEGYTMALGEMRSGKVLTALEKFAQVSTRLDSGEPASKKPAQ